MNRFYKTPFIVLVVLALPAVSQIGFADDKSDALRHFETGKKYFEEEKPDLAAAEFEASVRLYPTVSGYFNWANCLFAAGKFNDAMQAATEMTRQFEGKISAEITQETTALEQKIAKASAELRISVMPEDATLYVNDVHITPLPEGAVFFALPGTLALRAEKPGFETQRQTLSANAGTVQSIEITLTKSPASKTPVQEMATPPEAPKDIVAPAAPAAPSPQAVAASAAKKKALTPGTWATVGTTIGLGIATGVFAGIAQGKYTDAESFNQTYVQTGDPDIAQKWSDANDTHVLFKYLTWGFAAGTGAAAIVATILTARDLARNRKESTEPGRISVGPGSLEVTF